LNDGIPADWPQKPGILAVFGASPKGMELKDHDKRVAKTQQITGHPGARPPVSGRLPLQKVFFAVQNASVLHTSKA